MEMLGRAGGFVGAEQGRLAEREEAAAVGETET